MIEQRRAEQAALTPAQRAARVRKRDAASKAYQHYCDSPEGRADRNPFSMTVGDSDTAYATASGFTQGANTDFDNINNLI